MHFNSKYNGSSLAPDHFLKAYLINICIARQKNAISQDFFLHQEPFLFSHLLYQNLKCTHSIYTALFNFQLKYCYLIWNGFPSKRTLPPQKNFHYLMSFSRKKIKTNPELNESVLFFSENFLTAMKLLTQFIYYTKIGAVSFPLSGLFDIWCNTKLL